MERLLRARLVGGTFGDVAESHSRRMAAIRSWGNRTTELRFRAMLIRAGLRGWTIKTKGIKGRPDFFFPQSNVAVFIDGCYWHGCPTCGHIPNVNRAYWKAKIERNRQRDREITKILRRKGIKAIRFWEHELRDSPHHCLERLRRSLR